MNSRFPKPGRLINRVRELLQQGLWPYTPDPAPTGLLEIGSPPPGSPLILEGNSRHALARLRRVLQGVGGRVVVLDTGGLDLYQAFTVGKLRQETIAANLAQVTGRCSDEIAGEVSSSWADECATAKAILPFPLWQALDSEALLNYDIGPGPAIPESLPLYRARGELADAMKDYHMLLSERLRIALAQAALLLLVAVGPLLVAGDEALLIAVGIALAAAVGTAGLFPQLRKRLTGQDSHLSLFLYGVMFGVLVGVAPLVMGVGAAKVLLLVGIGTGTAVWMAFLCEPWFTPV